jgi:two-component system sensor kinase FixL
VARYERSGIAHAIGRIRDVHGCRKNGEIFPIELSVSEGRYGEERIYTAILRDVSERVRTQAQLHNLQQLAGQRERLADIGAITAQVVHDLGNPLAALSMQMQLLIRRLSKGADASVLLPTAERVLSSIHRLDEIMQDFSSFAREQRLELKDVSINDLLRPLRDLWFPLAASRSIDLVLELPEREMVLHADGQKLSRVIENLLKNAIEAIDQGPGLRHDPGGSVRLRPHSHLSADTGPGIPPNIDVFGLFETTKPGGQGLGLAIAKQIVVAHGGNIHCEARVPHGTVFNVDLPADGPAV